MQQLIIFIVLITILGCCFPPPCEADSKSQSNARIYRGEDAPKNKYPFYIDIHVTFPQVIQPDSNISLTNHGGGALISKSHILTVAHLFYPVHNKKKPYFR